MLNNNSHRNNSSRSKNGNSKNNARLHLLDVFSVSYRQTGYENFRHCVDRCTGVQRRQICRVDGAVFILDNSNTICAAMLPASIDEQGEILTVRYFVPTHRFKFPTARQWLTQLHNVWRIDSKKIALSLFHSCRQLLHHGRSTAGTTAIQREPTWTTIRLTA